MRISHDGKVGIGETAPVTLMELSSTAPYLTIHNTTHEDGNYGREGKIIFRGEQSGGEETVLGELEFSHDGASDSQNGKFSLRVNDGDDGTSPSAAVTIDSNLNVGLGDTDPSEAKLSIDNVASGDNALKLVQANATAALNIDMNANSQAIMIDAHQGTSNAAILINAPINTTNAVLEVTGCNSLTTGGMADFYSNSSTTDTRNLVKITNDHASASGATGLLIDQDANQTALKIDSESTSVTALDLDVGVTTTGSGLTVTAGSLSSGSAAIFNTGSTDLETTASGGFVEINHTGNSASKVNNLLFIKNDHASASATTGLYIQQDSTSPALVAMGNVGVGEATPVAKLHISTADASVTPSTSADEFMVENSGIAGITIASGTSSTGNIFFADSGDNAIGQISYNHSGDAVSFVVGGNKTPLKLDSNSRISLSNNDSGTSNTIFGKSAGASLDAGSNYNVFIGENVSDASMNDATYNVAVGYIAMSALTEGDYNTGIGYASLNGLTDGDNNVALGAGTLGALTTGHRNVAIGKQVGDAMTDEDDVVLIGYNAGIALTHTNSNGTVAIGSGALATLESGRGNIAIGYQALDAEDDGDYNTAVGYQALTAQTGTSGTVGNTAVGYQAGDSITSGTNNTILGYGSTVNSGNAINQTCIGAGVEGQADNSVTLGNTSVNAVYMGQNGDASVKCSNIQFPGTQIAAGNANTLDDYEEGTWTITCSTTDVTVNTSYDTMMYTKIGRLVNVYGRFRFSASTSPSADLQFAGLPFTLNDSAGEDGQYLSFPVYMKNAASAVNSVSGVIKASGSDVFNVVENCTTGAGEDLAAHVDTGTIMAINFSYNA